MIFFSVFFSNYIQSVATLKILMIVSEKSHQNILDYIQFLLKKKMLTKWKKGLLLVKKWEIHNSFQTIKDIDRMLYVS